MTASAECLWDVAVVGAGPAGSATALRLARKGVRTLLIEASRFDRMRVGESLAPAVRPLLEHLGAWSSFLELVPIASYGTRSVWGRAQCDEHSHLLTPFGCGWHIERARFDAMLANRAVAAGASLWLGARVSSCEATHAGFRLQLTASEPRQSLGEVNARFIVDATGRRTALARFLGARHKTFDRLIGIGQEYADPAASNHPYTLVETTPQGWWYAAPLAPQRSMLMLMTDADLARDARWGDSTQWLDALASTQHVRARVRAAAPSSTPHTYCAVSQRLLRDPQGPRGWLAVGDAALAVDPISGSGVIRAFRTAQAAAPAIIAALQENLTAIDEYEMARHHECTDYLIERANYYALEQRWRSAFWLRRQRAIENAIALAS